ncbi:glutamyl-tRNA synthetase [Cordyceps fumosorosea ARSEF 2679]|uniref:Glutamyl-tRNA synthetase n=1 Tax=Cordyceps fumosorosea (strain ARSEF 2679) TaxID=1081104 RepID=A0A167KSC6_CORFA|nr:glutamyl-tRNA synthetase [Cordyceps fumosorosea ARSEF 2679]OAA52123.1 glutamyl-tRNA synthetase [Cordyceps fumosorosea ARSEF 2679]
MTLTDILLYEPLSTAMTCPAADQTLWATLWSNKVARGLIRESSFPNVSRWFTHLEGTFPEIQQENQILPKPTKASATKSGSRYNMKLQDAEHGVVTSGVFWISTHRPCESSVLNDYFAHDALSGSLILRFDDTNPKKEKKEYEESIVEDLELYELCRHLISSGNLGQRSRLPYQRRDRLVSESLAIFEEMKAGSDFGKKHRIRARIAHDNSNGSLRDPIIYRFPSWKADKTPQPHHRTGWDWQIYPTYDFACPWLTPSRVSLML